MKVQHAVALLCLLPSALLCLWLGGTVLIRTGRRR